MFGLPNITGRMTVRAGVDVDGDFGGVFSYGRGVSSQAVDLFSNDRSVLANFSASSSHEAYGRSSSVQPSSLRVLPAIKI